MTIANIDFGRLYRDHMAATSRGPKPASAWDTRAAELNRKRQQGHYVDDFIARVDLTGADTLLDVGCGPGTLCLPLAARLVHVIGLDYSRGMLDALQANAAAQGQNNVETMHLAWEDDWSEVPPCDIVLASRSTTVEDMAAALHKLDAKAKKRVYLTHLVGGHFIDPAILDALGRKLPPLPDYIYLLNILHRMEIHPRLDYIETTNRLAGTADFDDFARQVTWTLGTLSADELIRLRAWHEHVAPGREGGAPMRWAFISWSKE